MSLQDARYRTPDAVNALFDRSLNRIRQLPGVADAAIALSLPYERALNNGWRFDGEATVQQQTITLTYVTPDYFRTLKTPVRAGRVFDDGDRQSSRKVVVVNDAFVRHFGQGRGVVGRLIHLGGAAQPAVEIVGVVGAIQQATTCCKAADPWRRSPVRSSRPRSSAMRSCSRTTGFSRVGSCGRKDRCPSSPHSDRRCAKSIRS